MGLCSAAALAVLATGVHHAAASSLPGEPLYTVKRWEETVPLSLARSPEEKAQKHLALAQRRLHEAQLLFLNGAESRAEATVLEYSESIATGLSYVAVTEEAQWADDQSTNQVLEEYREAFETFQMSVAFSPGLWSADARVILEKSWEAVAESEDDSEDTAEDQDAQTQEHSDGGQNAEEQGLDTRAEDPPTHDNQLGHHDGDDDRGPRLQSHDDDGDDDRGPRLQSHDDDGDDDRGPRLRSHDDDGDDDHGPRLRSHDDDEDDEDGDGDLPAWPGIPR